MEKLHVPPKSKPQPNDKQIVLNRTSVRFDLLDTYILKYESSTMKLFVCI